MTTTPTTTTSTQVEKGVLRRLAEALHTRSALPASGSEAIRRVFAAIEPPRMGVHIVVRSGGAAAGDGDGPITG